MFFAQTQIQSARHTAAPQDIVQEVHGQLLGVTDRVGVGSEHNVGLVGMAAVGAGRPRGAIGRA